MNHLRSEYPELKPDIRRVMAEGDLVVTHAHLVLTPGQPGRALADFWPTPCFDAPSTRRRSALALPTMQQTSKREEGLSDVKQPSARPRTTGSPVVLGPTAGFATVAVALASLYLAAGAPTPLLVVLQRRWEYPTWLLTIAFAIYAVALLVALLVVGSLSDFVGRKPVLLTSLAVEVLAMLMFVVAPSIGWIIAARAVQGLATGAATSAFTASLVELAPVRRPSLGPVIASIAPAGGLGLGALATGIVVQLVGASARTAVFTSLAAIMILALVVVPLTAETTQRRPGALASLVPQVSVPPGARREFGAAVPVLIAAWMLAGLFLGLVPTILRDLLGRESGLLDGVTVFLEPGTAAVAGLLLGRLPHRFVLVLGGAAALLGTLVVLVGVLLTALPLLWVGAVVGGVGFGASFSGALRVLGPLAVPHQRAGLIAAVYVVAYLAFGVPVVLAGVLDASLGLLPTVLAYIGVLAVASASGLIVQLRRSR